MKTAQLRNIFKSSYVKVVSVIIVLLIIGLSTVSNYGVSSDEGFEIWMVQWNYELITKGKPIPKNLKYYGTVFNFTSEAIFRANQFLGKKISYLDKNGKNHIRSDFYTRTKIKHYLTFLISLITYACIAAMVGLLVDAEYAWLGSVTLALFPRFWGHSFFNPKDIPFAAMFTLGIFLGGCLINYYLKVKREHIKIGTNWITFSSILYGILVGLVTGTRIGGLFLLPFIAFTHLAVTITSKSKLQTFFRFWSLYTLMFITWIITTTIIHPASWSNPILWLYRSLTYMSQHSWGGSVLFEGKLIIANSLPWYYLPKSLMITTPVFFQIMFFVGLLILLFKYKILSPIKKVFTLLLLLQIFFLPSIAILKQSTIYGGIRQFLFILPGIATFSAIAIACIYKAVPKKASRIVALVLIMVVSVPIVTDMITLHPYEYIYFNRVFGGLQKANHRYETDYWGLSMREGMEWINKNSTGDTKVVSSSQLVSSRTFADPHISIISLKNLKSQEISQPFYYIARPWSDFQDKFPECKVVNRVIRQNVPLTIVKECGVVE